MKTPFFSIIIPTFNRSKIISNTIESVLKQSYEKFEIIVVDDGSTDNTKNKVLEINDKRVKYIFQKNKERSAARNNGIRNSNGNWICFLDSDDEFEKDHLKNFYDRIKLDGTPKLFFTDQKIKNVTNDLCFNQKTKFNYSNPPFFFFCLSIVPGRICIHKDILKDFNFDENIVIVEDADLWFRISCHYDVEFINKSSFIYYLHEGNSVNVKNNAYLKRLKGLKRTFKKPEKKFLTKYERKKILNDCYFGIQKHYVARKKNAMGRLVILLALILYPNVRTKEKIFLLLYPYKNT